ncbi:hypothetical protein GCM10010946_16710 [Undibacterium squillarum]|uniref:Uncharacterized protein n=1 Tax=Undibacterium squillarum TaxID=1131567 RepID=A0ABQ2XYC0_9BURK|nr:hypothetical protein GCM10010946_16710 [Undibacterium squillarum]
MCQRGQAGQRAEYEAGAQALQQTAAGERGAGHGVSFIAALVPVIAAKFPPAVMLCRETQRMG